VPAPDGPERRPLAGLHADQGPRPPQAFGPDAVDPELLLPLFFWPALHRFIEGPGGEARLHSIVRRVRKEDPSFQERVEMFAAIWRDLLEGKPTDGMGLV
jgi:hypothetical protein